MVTEPKNQDVKTQEEAQSTEEPKTFTQEDVNRIVAGRIAKYADYEELKAKAAKFDEAEEASKSELQKTAERADKLQAELDSMKKAAKIQSIREEAAKESGVPANLLTGETKEDCLEQAKAIMGFARPAAYPSVKDGGEVRSTGKSKTRDQFADWANENFFTGGN